MTADSPPPSDQKAANTGAEIWDRAAASYDASRAHDVIYQYCLQATTRVVDRLQPSTLLEVGCGTGLTTLPLTVDGRRVTAVDYSLSSLLLLSAKAGAPPACQADILALPFLSESFGVVLCANVLQHLRPPEQKAAIRELQRVLARGGVLVVTVHHYSKAKRLAGWVKEGRPGQPGIDYIFRFLPGELSALLPAAKISAMGISGLRGMPGFLQRLVPNSVAGTFLARMGYGHMLVAIQRRPTGA